MKRLLATLAVLLTPAGAATADDAVIKAVIDRAVEALGGEKAKPGAFAVTTHHVIKTVDGRDRESVYRETIEGIDHLRTERFRDEPVLDGDVPWSLDVLNRDRGWSKVGGKVSVSLPANIANDQFTAARYAGAVSLDLFLRPVAGVESEGEVSVEGRPAVRLKAPLPGLGSLSVDFDKESGLPVRYTQRYGYAPNNGLLVTTLCRNFKEFRGWKVATLMQVKSEGTNGASSRYVTQIVDFKALDKVDPKTFEKPE